MFQEEVCGLAGLDGEVLLHLLTLATTKRGICQDVVKLVLGLDIGKVLSQGIGLDDIRRLNPVKYHIHHCDKKRERLFFLAVEGGLLQLLLIGSRMDLLVHIVVRFAEEPGGTTSAIIHRLPNLRIDNLDYGPDKRTGRVILTTIATGIPHLVQPAFVQVGHLVLLLAGLELQTVNLLNDVPKAIATDQLLQVREELAIHELYKVITDQGIVDVVLSGFGPRHSPRVPPVFLVQDGSVFPTTKESCHLILFIQIIQVFQEEYPGRLLHIVKFAAAPFIGTKGVIYILEDLLKGHGFRSCLILQIYCFFT